MRQNSDSACCASRCASCWAPCTQAHIASKVHFTALQITVMEEFEEEWPVAKESEQEVWTSEVALEPRSAKVPEIGMKDVEVEVRCAT